MKAFALSLSALLASTSVLVESSAEVINTCTLVDKPEPTGPYEQYTGYTKAAHAHIIFQGMSDETEQILDILQSRNNTKVTFFMHSDQITAEKKPLVQRMINEGHTIGSMGVSSNPQIDFLYANNTLIEEQIIGADAQFKETIGFVPNLFLPSFGGLDRRSMMILEQNGKTTVLWSAGANGWWFLDNDQPTETAVEALRYTLAEAGGILFMPNSAPILEEYFNQVWSYW